MRQYLNQSLLQTLRFSANKKFQMNTIACRFVISIRADCLSEHLCNILRVRKCVSASLCPASISNHSQLHSSFDKDCQSPNSEMSESISSTNRIDIAAMRMLYKADHKAFRESDLVAKEPFAQFAAWFKVATEQDSIGEANAMTLATASKEGKPSARMVLLKGYDKQGFKFFTNFESRKGRELVENPYASLCFYWEPLNRSVRVEGRVEKLSEEESTEYFHSRPSTSQIGAVISKQSTVIENRDVLTVKDSELKEKYLTKNLTIPKPEYWGGFRVVPDVIEFWQGQSNRLHDRIVFRRPHQDEIIDNKYVHTGDDGWVYERLSP